MEQKLNLQECIAQRFLERAAQDYADLIDDELLAIESWREVAHECVRVIAQAEALILALRDAEDFHRGIRMAAAHQCEVFYFG